MWEVLLFKNKNSENGRFTSYIIHTYIYMNIFIGDGKGKRNHAKHEREKETRLTVRKWII